jgi:hypothetical protein
MEQSFENENKISKDACGIFMNEVIMEEEYLQNQYKEHPSLQT